MRVLYFFDIIAGFIFIFGGKMELFLQDDTLITSKTDTSGRLLYGNEDFCRIVVRMKNCNENEESKNSSVPKLTHNIKKYKLKPVLTHYMKEIKKQEKYEAHLIKIRKIFSEKKYLVPEGKFFTYVIMPGNASYLVKNCFKHRVNWREPEMKISSIFNFKWQQTNLCIDFGSLSSIEKIPQIVNHFEFHSALSNSMPLPISPYL